MLSYIGGRSLSRLRWELCTQAHIYSIIASKEETFFSTNESFPHTHKEIMSIAAVQKLFEKDKVTGLK